MPLCQCAGHRGQHHRGLQGQGGGGGGGPQSPLPGQARPRAQHSLQAGVRISNIVIISYHSSPIRQSAVLHWFHNQRLMDPEAGREVGGVRQRICSEHMPQ